MSEGQPSRTARWWEHGSARDARVEHSTGPIGESPRVGHRLALTSRGRELNVDVGDVGDMEQLIRALQSLGGEANLHQLEVRARRLTDTRWDAVRVLGAAAEARRHGLAEYIRESRRLEQEAYESAATANQRRFTLVFFVAISTAAAATFGVYKVLQDARAGQLPVSDGGPPVTGYAVVIAAAISTLFSAYNAAASQRVERNVRRAIQSSEVAASDATSATDVALGMLEAASARERLTLTLAEQRLATLYRFGVALVVLAVVVPLFLAYAYYVQDPISDLVRLRQAGAPVPPGLPLTRDWHLLVAAGSIGLVLLAAARGVLNAEGRQRDAQVMAARREQYYADLGRALSISERLAEEEGDAGERIRRDVVRRVLVRLLDSEGPEDRGRADTSPTDDSKALHEHLRTLVAQFPK